MLLVRVGTMHLECEESGLTLRAGSLVLVPPGQGPAIRTTPEADVLAFYFGRSSVSIAEDEGPIGMVVGLLASPVPLFARLRPSDFREAGFLFESLRRETLEMRAGYLAMIRLRVTELLLILGRNQVTESRNAAASRPIAGAAMHLSHERFAPAELMRYIQEHYAQGLPLAELACHFGLNPSYLSRAFRRETGFTISAYVNKVRIERSCLLLKRSRATVLEIALMVGYSSLSHFNRSFRKAVGMSPREFRNRVQR